jgi:Arc/MetJ-type ribon-helix-helix transcriptional regulator
MSDEAAARKLEALRQALIEGEQSGIAQGFNFDDFIKEMKDTRARSKRGVESRRKE